MDSYHAYLYFHEMIVLSRFHPTILVSCEPTFILQGAEQSKLAQNWIALKTFSLGAVKIMGRRLQRFYGTIALFSIF